MTRIAFEDLEVGTRVRYDCGKELPPGDLACCQTNGVVISGGEEIENTSPYYPTSGDNFDRVYKHEWVADNWEVLSLPLPAYDDLRVGDVVRRTPPEGTSVGFACEQPEGTGVHRCPQDSSWSAGVITIFRRAWEAGEWTLLSRAPEPATQEQEEAAMWEALPLPPPIDELTAAKEEIAALHLEIDDCHRRMNQELTPTQEQEEAAVDKAIREACPRPARQKDIDAAVLDLADAIRSHQESAACHEDSATHLEERREQLDRLMDRGAK